MGYEKKINNDDEFYFMQGLTLEDFEDSDETEDFTVFDIESIKATSKPKTHRFWQIVNE